MNCPVDGSELRLSDRQGIEIDYCPQCRGIWLDRGELDKILERSAQAPFATPAARESDRYDEPPRPYRDEDRRGDDRRYDDRRDKKKRARSFLDDIFDFD
ncbi:MAG: zf-TFIIB domain-containing protein [Thermomicrobiales bacterium]|nr:zf-TFIIB domain-containing protein [Thermomicrobiales bacterium]